MGATTIARTRLAADGRVSVPAQIRQRLGVDPGSVLVWQQHGDAVIIRKAYSSVDIHRALFTKEPTRRPLSALDDGIRQRVRKRYASRSVPPSGR